MPMKKSEIKKERSINKNDRLSFLVTLQKGIVYSINVEQKGIDLVVVLEDKTGKIILEQDSPNGAFGPETIEYKPDTTQEFTLKIIPFKEGKFPGGKFKIDIHEKAIIDLTTPIVSSCTPAQMQEDLKIFRSIREEANSGYDRYRTTKELDSIYAWAFAQTKTSKNILEFYKIILVLTDFEGSLHNNTYLPYPVKDYFPKDKGYFPLSMKLIDDKMVVNSLNTPIPIGSRVVSINGVKDTDLILSFYKYSTTDGYNTSQKKLWSVEDFYGSRYNLEYGTQERFEIEYQLPDSDKVLHTELASISLQEKQNIKLHFAPYTNLPNEGNQNKYNFKTVNENTALLTIRSFNIGGDAASGEHKTYVAFLDSIFSKLKQEGKIKNLIIDIRNNGGGTDPNETKTFTYIADKPFKENKSAYISFNKLPLPQYYVYNSSDKDNQKMERKNFEKELNQEFSIAKNGKYYQNADLNPVFLPDSHSFTGQIYLLIDANVASAASNFASLVRGNTNAIVLGEETSGGYYGHNGHTPVTYQLPNTKIRTRFSIVNLEQYVPERTTQPIGRGVLPDYEVRQSLADFIQNKDTQMEFLLNLIKSKSKLD